MADDKFNALPLDEKFKTVRDDIKLLARHSNQNQHDIASISQTVNELRQEIQKLQAEVERLSRKA